MVSSGDLFPGLQERCGRGTVSSFCHCQEGAGERTAPRRGDGQWGGLGDGRKASSRGESPAGGGVGRQGSRPAWEHGGAGGASGGPRPGRHLSLVLRISGWSLGQQCCQADSGPSPTLLNQSPGPLALTHLLESSMPALGQLFPEGSVLQFWDPQPLIGWV